MHFDPRRRINLIICVITIAVGIFLDQITKYLAVKYLSPGSVKFVIPKFFNLELVRNRGGVFGIGSSWDPFWHKFLFVGISLIAIFLIGYFLYRSLRGPRLIMISLALIFAGAVGNIYDRIVHGAVVDFLAVHYNQYRWPNFNIADSLICIGVGLYLLHSLFLSKKPKHA